MLYHMTRKGEVSHYALTIAHVRTMGSKLTEAGTGNTDQGVLH